MQLNRRDLLLSSGAVAISSSFPARPSFGSPGTQVISAQVAKVQIAPPAYPKTEVWGYGGSVPGPEIRLRQGQKVQARLENELPTPTTIHWHGIRNDNAMDGVAGLTQPAVASGGSFFYEFTPPDAGTYWYHAHTRSFEQVARGLYGPLIVEETELPDVDREEVLILDDMLLDPDSAQLDPDFSSSHALSHAGRLGNVIVTNGQYDLVLKCLKNERLRLRVINAANARTFALDLAGMAGWVVALDGMPLKKPYRADSSIILGAAQRVDLIVDITADEGETAHLAHRGRGDSYSLVAFSVDGKASHSRRNDPAPLPSNETRPISGLENAQHVNLSMVGGAMSGSLVEAKFNGKKMTFPELIEANQFWAFGDTVGMPDAPLIIAHKGEPIRLTLENKTAFAHAMHLHGMHFQEIEVDGSLGPMRDTLMVMPREVREIAFMADNPGKWLFHCHMLSHAASGMMTWIEVTA